MAVAPALVANFSFNPPVVSLSGPIAESTVAKLSEQLPRLTTNSVRGRKAPPTFRFLTAPHPHWLLEMPSLVADDISQMTMMLAVLDCLEDEGGWSMRDCHAITADYVDNYTFMFTKKTRR
jgi:hypothetical protein